MEKDAFDLSGRVALITGGNGGIGLGMAEGLAKAGAAVAIAARDQTKMADAQAKLEKLGAQVITVSVDVGDRASIDNMVAEVVKHFGRVDILVANAGINVRSHLRTTRLTNGKRSSMSI